MGFTRIEDDCITRTQKHCNTMTRDTGSRNKPRCVGNKGIGLLAHVPQSPPDTCHCRYAHWHVRFCKKPMMQMCPLDEINSLIQVVKRMARKSPTSLLKYAAHLQWTHIHGTIFCTGKWQHISHSTDVQTSVTAPC